MKFHQPHKIKGSLQFIGDIRAVLCDTTVLNYNREIVRIVEVFGKGRVDRGASEVRILTTAHYLEIVEINRIFFILELFGFICLLNGKSRTRSASMSLLSTLSIFSS